MKLFMQPMRDVHEARQAVEEAQAQEVELDEAHQRREQELRPVPRAIRAGGGPARRAWCSGSACRGSGRGLRRIRAAGRPPALPASRRRAPFRAPCRRSSAPAGGRRGAGSSPDSLRRARASGRGSGCGGPCGRRAPTGASSARTRLAASSGDTRSSASRHSTQSLRRLLDRELLLPAEAQPFLVQHARAVAFGERRGAVGAAGVDDQDFIGEGDAGEAFGELRGGVVRDQDNGERQGKIT